MSLMFLWGKKGQISQNSCISHSLQLFFPKMTYIHFNLIAIAGLAITGMAQLQEKNSLLPSGGIEQYGSRLSTAWNRPNNVISFTDWENITAKRGMIPVACVGNLFFPGGWLTPFKSVDMRVYDVVYSDCSEVFQLCIHKDATKSLSHGNIIRVCPLSYISRESAENQFLTP
jgi:hypothetical protein